MIPSASSSSLRRSIGLALQVLGFSYCFLTWVSGPGEYEHQYELLELQQLQPQPVNAVPVPFKVHSNLFDGMQGIFAFI